MISIKSNDNLEGVLDFVGKMQNDIQSVIGRAVEEAREEIYTDLINTYQIGVDDLVIEFTYDAGDYKLTVDGINPYQLYNNIGVDMDYMLDIIESKMLSVIQQHLADAGYSDGN
jgi:hypothetical protein